MGSYLDELGEMFKDLQASEEFDKQCLLQAQERFYNSMQDKESEPALFTLRASLPVERRPAVPLAGLRPIRAKDLGIGKRHHGRVLFGTLCADAHKIVDIMTVLEDEYGDGVRLAVCNPSLSMPISTQEVRRMYPKGAKVAVKEPYLKRAQDGMLMLRVNNPEHVEFVTSFQVNPQTASAVDLLQLRNNGNSCFKNQDWKGALGYYSKCIQLALSHKHGTEFPRSSKVEKFQKEVDDALLYSYSNRAEAKLKLKKYGLAVPDCDQALQVDPLHLKSIFRKGRALQELGEYRLSCDCLLLALQQCPSSEEIKLLYERSKKLDDENQQGKFDLSSYFLNNCNPEDAPEVSDFIGPVTIERSVGRGRGLFASDDIGVGETVLVENAIAMTGVYRSMVERDLINNSARMPECVKNDTVSKVISCALSSSRILQQLECLLDSERQVPDMDLFRINKGNWSKYDVCKGRQNLQLDKEKLIKAMERNLLLTQMTNGVDIFTENQNIPTSSMVDERWGFWALASFINHSCFPNAKCMVVGKSMFVIAVRKITAGEEITVPYFHSLFPLAKREKVCKRMGFDCVCERCMFERSLGPAFAKISESLDNVILSRRLLWLRNEPKKYLESIIEIAMWLEKEIEVQSHIITVAGKRLILASFEILYSIIFASGNLIYDLNITMPPSFPSILEVAEAAQHAEPGSCGPFHIYACLHEGVYKENSLFLRKAIEVGVTAFGRQEVEVIKSLLKVKPR
ncbi:hypothetical protein KI387_013693, partial [Taxus chinensis]